MDGNTMSVLKSTELRHKIVRKNWKCKIFDTHYLYSILTEKIMNRNEMLPHIFCWEFEYLQDRIVIVMDVYIKNNILKKRKPKLLKTLPPSFPIS